MEGLLPRNRYARFAVYSLLAIVMVVAFLCFFYIDLYDIYDNTMVFWEGVFQGKNPLDFYDYSVELTRASWGVNYNFFPYILTAIWCLPVFLIYKFRGIDYLPSVMGHMWFKLLLVVGLLVATYLVMRILAMLGKDKRTRRAAAFFFLSSTIVITSVLIIPNIEIFALCFMLAGVLCLLKRRNVWFLAFFAMATACKSFAVFLVLPLVLLTEKNVYKAIGKVASTLLVILVEKVLFSGSPTYGFAIKANMEHALEEMFTATFMNVAPFVLMMVFICIVCYLHKPLCWLDAPDEGGCCLKTYDAWLLVYMGALVYGSLAVCMRIQEYWALLFMPFLTLIFTRKERLAPILALMETIGSAAYVFYCVFQRWALNEESETLARGILMRFGVVPTGEHVRYVRLTDLLGHTPFALLKDAYLSIFVACMIVVLVLSAPYIADKLSDKLFIDKSVAPLVAWIRVAFIGCFVAMILLIRLMWTTAPLYTNMNEAGASYEQPLFADVQGHEFVQKLDLGNISKVNSVSLKFNNDFKRRDNFASAVVEMWDTTDQKCVWSKTIGATEINDDAPTKVKTGGIDIVPGHSYELRVTGKPGVQDKTAFNLYVYTCPTEGDAGLTYDGAPITGTLQYEIG